MFYIPIKGNRIVFLTLGLHVPILSKPFADGGMIRYDGMTLPCAITMLYPWL
jgi:hypothetical protein